jgi:hypothetical protein
MFIKKIKKLVKKMFNVLGYDIMRCQAKKEFFEF